MNYLLSTELSLFAPQVTIPSDATKKQGLIMQASGAIDAFCRRALDIRTYTNEQMRFDLNMGGILRHTPWREWVGTETSVIKFGDGGLAATLTYADFDVDEKSGVVRYCKSGYMDEFGSGTGVTKGVFGEAISPYHAGTYQQIDGNDYPYSADVSYKAGYFVVHTVQAQAATGATSCTLDSVSGIDVGAEFYFASDPVSESDVPTRLVESVNTTTNVVTFSPALGYVLPAATKFRKIDFAVRMATAEIIAARLTYAPDTRRFAKSLGNGALVKSWTSNSSGISIPLSAAQLLGKYLF